MTEPTPPCFGLHHARLAAPKACVVVAEATRGAPRGARCRPGDGQRPGDGGENSRAGLPLALLDLGHVGRRDLCLQGEFGLSHVSELAGLLDPLAHGVRREVGHGASLEEFRPGDPTVAPSSRVHHRIRHGLPPTVPTGFDDCHVHHAPGPVPLRLRRPAGPGPGAGRAPGPVQGMGGRTRAHPDRGELAPGRASPAVSPPCARPVSGCCSAKAGSFRTPPVRRIR